MHWVLREGVSIFVSSGDEGAASSDANRTVATHGIAVSGWTSTPYNVSVGGTDYGDNFLGDDRPHTGTPPTVPNYLTAKSYMPEIPWNDSCASHLIYVTSSFASAVGTNGFCNSTTPRQASFLTTASGSGGPSGCATGTCLNTQRRQRNVRRLRQAFLANRSWQSSRRRA